MPNVKLKKIGPHKVYVDTNILWHEDKSFAVSPDFENFWEKHIKITPLQLALSEVVIGELKFQQTTSARKIFKKIENECENLSKVTQVAHSFKKELSQVEQQISDKIDKWVKKSGALLLEVPVLQVDWKALIDQAIWRMPPFSFESKNPDHEKGFRDALILETLYHYSKAKNVGNIVFITLDELLRESAEKRFKNNQSIQIYGSLGEFDSYLRLTQEQLTNDFAKNIQNHARLKFFRASKPTSLYYKLNVGEEIRKKFSSEMSNPKQNISSNTSTLLSLGRNQWHVKKEMNWIFPPQFKEKKGDKEFFWISKISVAKLLVFEQSLDPNNVFLPNLPSASEINVYDFEINWRASVKTDGRFYEPTIEDIKFTNSQNMSATSENIEKWKLGD